jgi:hypothetical protein
MTKRSRAKLPLRKETLRALTELDLVRVPGGRGQGDGAVVDATFGRTCLTAAAAPTA